MSIPIVVASEKPWNKDLVHFLESKTEGFVFHQVSQKDQLTEQNLKAWAPAFVFFPHWSHLIPESIFDQFTCVVFHMTDLPFGRGGSPLQNLIAQGLQETRLSALRVTKGVDEGPVFMKAPLSLLGSAEEIFVRTNELIGQMILEILRKNPVPTPQQGKPTKFARRKPEQSSLQTVQGREQAWDLIRMLDAETYPRAFIPLQGWRVELTAPRISASGEYLAQARLVEDKQGLK